jgi:hypothetical protein
MQDPFQQFEDRIQRLVEGGFARLLAGRLHPREVAIQLSRAMEDHAQLGPGGQRLAPDVFVVRLNPEDHTAILIDQPDFEAALGSELIELARLSGLALAHSPEVRLLADSRIVPHHVSISARNRAQRVETTQGIDLSGGVATIGSIPKAVLIVNGVQHVPLDRPIMNVGRHRDNDIILDSTNVSRHHAQIRLRFGRFVLFDLGSTGGTMVNGAPIREAVLQTGDVIRLIDVNLVYVEEEASLPADVPPEPGGGTEPLRPAG